MSLQVIGWRRGGELAEFVWLRTGASAGCCGHINETWQVF